MDGEAWWAAVHGVVKSQIRLSDFTFTFHFHALEKAMATHSSVLAWRVAQSGTRLKWLSSSSSAKLFQTCPTLRPYGLYPTRLLCSWDSPGKNTGVSFCVLLQGSNPCLLHLLHWQVGSLPLVPLGKLLDSFRCRVYVWAHRTLDPVGST